MTAARLVAEDALATPRNTSGLVELTRACLSRAEQDSLPFYVAPGIPPAKEAGARRVHAEHLPAHEPLLALYDDTMLGSAVEGFIVTPERICWKNLLQHPRQVPWRELDMSTVLPLTDGVGIAGGVVQTSESAVGRAVRLFTAMAERAAGPEASPYRAPTDDAALAVKRIVRLARKHVGEVPHFFYAPAIPRAKLAAAHRVHGARLGSGDPIAVVYEDTVLLSARQGFVITATKLLWSDAFGGLTAVELSAIEPDLVVASGSMVHVMSWELHAWPFTAGTAALIAAAARAAG